MIQAGNPATKPNASALPDTLHTYTIPEEFNAALYHKKGALAAARQGNEINPYMRSSGTQFYIVQGTRLNEQELNIAEQRINSQIRQAQFRILLRETADSVRAAGSSLSDAEIQDIASYRMFQYMSSTPEFKLTPEQRDVYMSIGGTPFLDGTYTVFGEVTEGLEIVDRIAAATTDPSDKPVTDIVILKMTIVNN
jgi:peptidyl-prolyl cis-trans isomerase B (cyclophilin B)